MPDKPHDRFMDFLTRLVRVPKEEIDKQERKYEDRKTKTAAKSGEIVPKDHVQG